MKPGQTFSWERTFTVEDIKTFTSISGDAGEHHVAVDEQGRLMAHGLLTATLPTKIGGDLNFIARQMTFEFVRPVFSGDTIRCDVTVTAFEQQERYATMSCTWICRNQEGKEVLTGAGHGIIRHPR